MKIQSNDSSYYTSYEKTLVEITSLIGYYIIPATSFVGFITNLFCLLVCLNPKFQHKDEFKYIIVKIFMETFGCLALIGFQNYLECVFEPYLSAFECDNSGSLFLQVFRLIFYKYICYGVYAWSVLNEIFLCYDRHLVFSNKKNWFNKPGTFKYLNSGIVLFLLVLNLPSLFAFRIKALEKDESLFYLELTEFGRSEYYSIHMVTILGVANVLAAIVLTPMLILNARDFKNFIRKKIFLSASFNSPGFQPVLVKREDLKFNKMTFLMIFLFVSSRLIDLIATIMYRIIVIYKINDFYVFVFIDNLSYLSLTIVTSLNFFILYYFNKIFRNFFKDFFIFKFKKLLIICSIRLKFNLLF